MLLLYTKLFGYKLTRSEPDIVPNQFNFNESQADSEQHSSAQFRSTQKTEEIRRVEQAYHLERRFLM
ncbi:radical SAM protein [Tychonema sp. LEGE 07203]|uniref:radical SAM protein n=1 Tax=Tychonema sp. LEGE 07203 TaxID=1828671 RepID=UPI001D1411C7|nr:radical SAM protein [Tychonema sp. LEGE 07203]